VGEREKVQDEISQKEEDVSEAALLLKETISSSRGTRTIARRRTGNYRSDGYLAFDFKEGGGARRAVGGFREGHTRRKMNSRL